jgi:hypothetical protein
MIRQAIDIMTSETDKTIKGINADASAKALLIK